MKVDRLKQEHRSLVLLLGWAEHGKRAVWFDGKRFHAGDFDNLSVSDIDVCRLSQILGLEPAAKAIEAGEV